MAGLHGNEPAGVLALRRILLRHERSLLPLRGTLVAIVGNRAALAAGRRYLSRDLNRLWRPEILDELGRPDGPRDSESVELRELSATIHSTLQAASGPVFCLDLHTTSGGVSAFALHDDTLAIRRFAFAIPVPHVLGFEESLSGTLVSHLCERGVRAIGFEAGQHDDPVSVDRAEAAVWIAIHASGLLTAGSPEYQSARRWLRREGRPFPSVVELRQRYAIEHGDDFEMAAGFQHFDRVRPGQVVAHHHGRPVAPTEKALLLMPMYQGQGEDGFFLVRPVREFWLRLSSVLRRLRVDRIMHWLPGVTRDPASPRGFLVDRGRARWYALELFHLLGYRRTGSAGNRLSMRRRDD